MISGAPTNLQITNTQSLGAKSNATVASHSAAPATTKLPPNAKVVGNYLMGNGSLTKVKTSAKALLGKYTSPCTSQPVRKWL